MLQPAESPGQAKSEIFEGKDHALLIVVVDSDIPQEGESFSEVKCDFLATTLQSVHSDILFYAYFGQGENKGLSAFRKVSVNPTFSWIEHMNLFFLSHKTLLQGPFKISEPLFLVPHCSFLHI